MEKNYALVTGASSGIGMEIAKQLAEKGYSLILVARRKERLETLKSEIERNAKVKVVIVAQDLSEPNAAEKVMAAVEAQGLALDILVNNAGYGIQGKFLDMKMADIEQMFRLNMTALTHLTQLAARAMKARGHGRILQVASAGAFLPTPYVSAYAATKAYVLSFSEAIRFELKGSGVTITTIYPGITTTEFNQVADAKTPPMMNLSILSAEKVARIGLRAMFRGRRAVVPGFINKLNAYFSYKLPRGIVISMAGGMLKKANNQ
jgi:uncharacterized protein